MKQVLQDLLNGRTIIEDAPSPSVSANEVLIHTTQSLISAGTERMLVSFGKASFLEKARQQPDKVKMVLNKAKTDGIAATYDSVKSKLSQPIPLGYCNVGIVAEVGDCVKSFKKGDRVVSNGPHADVVAVSENLCAKIPDDVSDEEAAFTVVGSIGLQAIRLAKPSLGERFVVIGVGLIGLISVQLLRSHGCKVLAIDFDDAKLALAKKYGAQVCNPKKGEDSVKSALLFSDNLGVDAVLIAASTKSNEPVSQAAQMCRKRGRIVLLGTAGLNLSRADFYEKELSFQVSCSYGPGRYDPEYEDKSNDYPLPFVRWTLKRNFEAVLGVMEDKSISIDDLITHRFDFKNALDAYEILDSEKNSLGLILNYNHEFEERTKSSLKFEKNKLVSGKPNAIAFIGAGNYASRILIPSFKKTGVPLHTLVSSRGISSVVHGKRFSFLQASTNVDEILACEDISTVVIATRHNTHAQLVKKCLNARKHIFVEKPLALTLEELQELQTTYNDVARENMAPQLMVGFNRRFSPQIVKMKKLLATTKEAKSFIMTINAGRIPAEHWTQDKVVGGGRIVGEACHFIDLMRFLADCEIVHVSARSFGDQSNDIVKEDKATITLGFKDGSFGSIHYLANGSASFPKERIEVFAGGKILQLDNFRKLRGYGWNDFKSMNLWKQNKGQNECVKGFVDAVENGESLIPIKQIFEVAHVSIDIAEMIRMQKD